MVKCLNIGEYIGQSLDLTQHNGVSYVRNYVHFPCKNKQKENETTTTNSKPQSLSS